MPPVPSTWKTPPKAKIYEALSAVADGRVRMLGLGAAEVISSDRSKSYRVEWSEDLSAFTSNDNGSYWQGYIGYPIIAVLLLTGKLEYDAGLASALAGVPWKALNTKHRRDYGKAIDEVLAGLAERSVDIEHVRAYVDRLWSSLPNLGIARLRSSRVPPGT